MNDRRDGEASQAHSTERNMLAAELAAPGGWSMRGPDSVAEQILNSDWLAGRLSRSDQLKTVDVPGCESTAKPLPSNSLAVDAAARASVTLEVVEAAFNDPDAVRLVQADADYELIVEASIRGAAPFIARAATLAERARIVDAIEAERDRAIYRRESSDWSDGKVDGLNEAVRIGRTPPMPV